MEFFTCTAKSDEMSFFKFVTAINTILKHKNNKISKDRY